MVGGCMVGECNDRGAGMKGGMMTALRRPFPHALGEGLPESLRELLRRALQEPRPDTRHRAAHLRGGVPAEPRAVRRHGLDLEGGADIQGRARGLAVGGQREALGRDDVRQLDVDLELDLHAPDAYARNHLEVPVVHRLDRFHPGGDRRHELIVQQPFPDLIGGRRDLGRPRELEPHYVARARAPARARRAASWARWIRYSAEAWMSSFASTPATAVSATCAMTSPAPSRAVPTRRGSVARNGVSASPVKASSAPESFAFA